MDAADGARHMVGSPLQHEEGRDHAPVRPVEAEAKAHEHGNDRRKNHLLGSDHGMRILHRGAVKPVPARGPGMGDSGAIRVDVGDMIGKLVRIGAEVKGAVMCHDGVLGCKGALY